jgi:exodeoxyribonuclease V alpha subunit
VSDLLSVLREAGAVSPIDVQLALTVGRITGDTRAIVALATALASRATTEGHVCVELPRLSGTEALGPSGEPLGMSYPSLDEFAAALRDSAAVGDGSRPSVLVVDRAMRLYLYRFYEHEVRLARALSARSLATLEPPHPEVLRTLLPRLFGGRAEGEVDWQRVAAQVACLSSLSVVSGGPGTGKTSTVIRLIALTIADLLSRGVASPRVLLLAPTGKAAARLAEATAKAKASLDCPKEILDFVPSEARTVHRALEAGHDGRFRLNASRPLLADVVAVDEASMIDVALMRHLVEAVPERARLVLLGDRHQLSSVEAGAVLADVCGDADRPRFSRALAARVKAVFGEELPDTAVTAPGPGIDDGIVTLSKSHRFSSESRLGALARAIQEGRADDALALFGAGTDLTLVEEGDGRRSIQALRRATREGFGPLAKSTTAQEALSRLDAFRILCAPREGQWGVVEMNRWAFRDLSAAGSIQHDHGFLHPVLITRNDASLDLFNGDVGVVFRDQTTPGAARAVFRGPGGQPRALSLSRLPPHETAFAMSVHKSQGSEFDDVVVVLPRPGSPLLSRELVYTAVTRARRRVLVHGTVEAFREALGKPVQRASGLAAALRGA